MALEIYPPIGFARVGNSPDAFFIGPEEEGHPGLEFGAGGEAPVSEYKDGNLLIKRQAARFRLFERPDGGGDLRPAELPADAVVEWTVHLVNRKEGVERGSTPPRLPRRPVRLANPASRTIDPGPRTVAGAAQSGSAFKFHNGEYLGRRVPLGELRTDEDQNLIVLGGHGFSSSPANAPIPSFYTNPGWHDDTSDGPVTAIVRLANGEVIDDIAPAWVVTSTPDYAPAVEGVVTLYDILFDVAVQDLGHPAIARPSFTRDVFPMLRRTNMLQWVNSSPTWTDMNDDWAVLADPGAGAAALRADAADVVESVRDDLSQFRLTSQQEDILQKYVAGDFDADWNGIPVPSGQITSHGLTRAALDGTVGQGFFPGIEAGIIVRDASLYAAPFRINHDEISAGDLTAEMACPWQADFMDCQRGWWPAQRPDDVRTDANSTTTRRWERGVSGHRAMVDKFGRLGFVVPVQDAAGNIVFVEDQRAAVNGP